MPIPFDQPLLVGVVHLQSLPGSPSNRLPVSDIVDLALRDAHVLQQAGFGAIIVENFGDAPFVADRLDPASIASLAVVAGRIKQATTIPLGVNALRNDARAALAVAAASGADFIRVNVHVGLAATDQGLIEGKAAETLNHRRSLNLDVAIFADVHVKHAVTLHQPDIALAAEETAYRGLADALIISGPTTGRPTDTAQIQQVKSAVPDRPVLVGSGATADTVRSLLEAADGVIVGTGIKEGGKTTNPVDPERAGAFVSAARS